MSNELDAAINQLLAEAQAAFTSSNDLADIKRSTDTLRAALHAWKAQDERVKATLRGLLNLVCARCKHDGAARGHNERDGSWMAPCPTCGDSR